VKQDGTKAGPPLPDVVVGVIGVGIPLPSLAGVRFVRLSVDVLDRLPARPANTTTGAGVSREGRALVTPARTIRRREHAFVIESSECLAEVGLLVDRLVRDPLGAHDPRILIAGPLPDVVTDHALYARVQVYPRSLLHPDALEHALVVAAWSARDLIRRDPERGVEWAKEVLAPWLWAQHHEVLTERQAQVFAIGVLGLNHREIAAALKIDRNTVEKHAIEIMERIGVAAFERATEPVSAALAAAIGDGPQPPERLPRDYRKTSRDGNTTEDQTVTVVGTKGPTFRKGS
jgi:hypothetical protein